MSCTTNNLLHESPTHQNSNSYKSWIGLISRDREFQGSGTKLSTFAHELCSLLSYSDHEICVRDTARGAVRLDVGCGSPTELSKPPSPTVFHVIFTYIDPQNILKQHKTTQCRQIHSLKYSWKSANCKRPLGWD